ncbi:MAG: hypothetical protein AAGD25_02760 [Cyanobacteria bacterium P01_F01_bin.150]
MSKIILYLNNSSNYNQSFILIKKYTEKSLSDIRKALASDAPIAEFIIYENDHDLIAGKIKKLVTDLSNYDSQLEIYEVDLEEDSEACDESTKISLDILFNLLDAFSQERETQRHFSSRES